VGFFCFRASLFF